MMPARIESLPSDGTDLALFEYVSDAGSAPERSTSARSCASCCVKLPGDPRFGLRDRPTR